MATDTPTLPPGTYLVRERAAEDRSEYWDGEVVAMAGASRSHNRIVRNLVLALGNRFGDGPCEVFATDLRVRVETANAYTYPDLAIVCGDAVFEDEELDVLVNPTLLIEVLSASTERRDRLQKAPAYKRIEGLREYALISQYEPSVEVHTRSGDFWIVTVVVRMEAEVPLASVGLRLPMGEIYRRVFPD
ncbi:MAG TPA: Uma2 family endonuclease [Longimicrobium sp.]|nr:Uma2 family endonuclease [Longimicrobium sp.]